MSDDFNWNDSNDVIAVAFQERIAVYKNGEREIVIRQDGHGFCRDDAWIVVRPENVRQLVDAMLALLGPEQAANLPLLPGPADRTAAERQRRYRNAKRNGSPVTPTVTDTVTDRDSHGETDLFVGAPARGGGR